MRLLDVKESRFEEETKRLCVFLIAVSKNSKDRIETLRELVESEFIPEEMFLRFVEGEKKVLLDEIQNYVNLYKGLN